MKTLIYIGIWVVVFAVPSAFAACDDYKHIPTEELKEYRAKLIEPQADPFDRLFAFEQLSCSDRPTIRNFAIVQGMRTAKDDLIRHEIALQAILQRRQIVIELVASNAGNDVKATIESLGGAILETVRARFPTEGCVTWSNDKACEGWYLQISGGKALVNGNGYDGFFELTSQGELVGHIRRSGKRIPAKIPLN